MCHVGPRLASAPKNAEKHRQNDKSELPGMRNFHLPGRSTVHSLNAMVATSHPLAALTAIEVMRAGGTAADAAVAPRIAFDWKNQFDKLKKGTNTGRYLLPHGKPAVAGDVIRQPELAQTLRAIAKDGRDAFYKGPIAEDMVETLRAIGGLHTLD